MAALKVKLTRGNTATINNTAITDGQILYNTQTGAQYLDNNTTRISIGQTLTVDTKLSKTSYNPIANIGVAGVMISSLSEISTITQAGNIPDALAVKELNSNISTLFDGYKIKFFLSKSITFTSGIASFNTGITTYTEMRIFHVHLGATTIISVSSISNGVVTFQSSKFDGTFPSYTDTVDVMVVYK
jgi:hypothetical protein